MPISHNHAPDLIIAVLGTIAIMLIPVAIVLIVLRHRREMAAQKLRTIAELVSKGASLPAQLLLDSPQKPGVADLRRGLVLAFTGMGAVIFAFTLPDHEGWGVGLLPLFAGLGYLATWLFSRSDKSPDGDA